MHLQAFRIGQTGKIQTGELGQILQENFYHGQWRYCIAVPGRDRLVWEWEGHLRSEHSTIHGR